MMKEWSVVEVERRTGYILPRSCAQARYPFPWMAAGDEDVQEAASRGGVALVLGIIVLGFAMIAGETVIDSIEAFARKHCRNIFPRTIVNVVK